MRPSFRFKFRRCTFAFQTGSNNQAFARKEIAVKSVAMDIAVPITTCHVMEFTIAAPYRDYHVMPRILVSRFWITFKIGLGIFGLAAFAAKTSHEFEWLLIDSDPPTHFGENCEVLMRGYGNAGAINDVVVDQRVSDACW